MSVTPGPPAGTVLSDVMGGWETANIVSTWLNFLHVGEYSNKFIDNGYDDLETVKQMGEEDLRAIGVDNQDDEEVEEVVPNVYRIR